MHRPQNNSSKNQRLSQPAPLEGPKNLEELFALYRQGQKDKTWQRIVKALTARGFPVQDEDLPAGKQ